MKTQRPSIDPVQTNHHFACYRPLAREERRFWPHSIESIDIIELSTSTEKCPKIAPLSPIHTIKRETPLRANLSRRHAHEQLSGFDQMRLNDASGTAFWRDFEPLNQKVCDQIFGHQAAGILIEMTGHDVHVLAALLHKPATVSQFIYWLLVSEQGPKFIVATGPKVDKHIARWLHLLGLGSPGNYVAQSRYKKMLRDRHQEAVVLFARLQAPYALRPLLHLAT